MTKVNGQYVGSYQTHDAAPRCRCGRRHARDDLPDGVHIHLPAASSAYQPDPNAIAAALEQLGENDKRISLLEVKAEAASAENSAALDSDAPTDDEAATIEATNAKARKAWGVEDESAIGDPPAEGSKIVSSSETAEGRATLMLEQARSGKAIGGFTFDRDRVAAAALIDGLNARAREFWRPSR